MNTKVVFALLIASSFLGGCARMLTPQGDDKYDCNRKENPDSPYCHSFKAIDSATKAPLPVTRYDAMTNMSTVDQYTGVAPGKDSSKSTDPLSSPSRYHMPVFYSSVQQSNGAQAEYIQKQPRDGAPIREIAPIQRIWVKRHRDSSDRLIGTTVVYAELGENRWAGFDPVENGKRTSSSTNRQIVPHLPAAKESATTPKAAPAQPSGSRTGAKFQQPGSNQAEDLETHPASQEMGESSLPN
jgi:hypothetical protein